MSSIIFDTETNKLHGDIIQAAYINIQIDDGEVSNSGSFMLQNFKPNEAIDFEAMAVHNIIADDLKDCPSFTQCCIPKVEYVIGHSIDYDMEALQRAGQFEPFMKRICTLAIMRYLYPQLKSHKLGVLCYQFSENLSETRELNKYSHNALTDCYLTQVIVENIVKTQAIKTIDELHQLSEKARYPTHFYWGKFKGRKISDIDSVDLIEILNKESDRYVLTAIEEELYIRDQLELKLG
ncbi:MULTISPECIES: 3'-5' exonuclease [unclassified Acinetobacter]|uniref:3'-5' exonuclease n=1 Tax=unclassified Acinetobacter TaxID=196816 RepID=UPI0022ABD5FE|nr:MULTISPECIES: 3'-5' exonuclease [unclassified Acinetobacter]WAU72984.1 3'-5' exonuclease [Acinetobacter sp. TR11]WAU76077.1 3'-5' exonuclease [Acinetobacter sp. TR3]